MQTGRLQLRRLELLPEWRIADPAASFRGRGAHLKHLYYFCSGEAQHLVPWPRNNSGHRGERGTPACVCSAAPTSFCLRSPHARAFDRPASPSSFLLASTPPALSRRRCHWLCGGCPAACVLSSATARPAACVLSSAAPQSPGRNYWVKYPVFDPVVILGQKMEGVSTIPRGL